MLQAYNFLASWQLFPEKGTYESGDRPKSGYYKIAFDDVSKQLKFSHTWVSLDGEAFESEYSLHAHADVQKFPHPELADTAEIQFIDSIQMDLLFKRAADTVLHIQHEIQPNGYLKIIQHGFHTDGNAFTNTEWYHKQLSVLPYAASVAGALVKPTEEGVIRHKALTAMEEQTNMQLQQIKQQIELLALQAQEIHKRKELSMMIYNARLSFKPNIGQTYYLYERKDGSFTLSLVSPGEWGGSAPFRKFVAAVKLLADHTWKEV